jgi:2-polyprenyl-6-methoxyphenol hydroxylase-like FAD-dependent oxidoreductase
MHVLISGAGIAGPSLAYWLGRGGHTVTVVERAPALRASGAGPVDFRGDQLALLDRMGVRADIEAHQTGVGDQIVIDATGRRRSTFPSALFSGDIEIERSDLSRILYEHSRDRADYVFGDHITALTDTADGVDVTFASGRQERFDLVVGADGLHSAVRTFAFGDEHRFRHDLGLGIAGFQMPNVFGIDHSGLVYNVPNRMVMVTSGRDTARAGVAFLFTDPPADLDWRDTDAQRAVIADRFADAGWRVPELLAALRDVPELYFDTIGQIKLDRWSRGRVVLLGDAAWCTGPGGNATGHAMLGAYTLAGELAAGDHATAFDTYERIMRPKIAKSQQTAAGAADFLTPSTERKIRNRDLLYRVLSSPALTVPFRWLAQRTANTGTLKDYPELVASQRVR